MTSPHYLSQTNIQNRYINVSTPTAYESCILVTLYHDCTSSLSKRGKERLETIIREQKGKYRNLSHQNVC